MPTTKNPTGSPTNEYSVDYSTLTSFGLAPFFLEPGTNLGKCAGDCDNGDCREGLECFHLGGSGYSAVPGCHGEGFPIFGYCIDPASKDYSTLTSFGWHPGTNLGKCVGDCDNNSCRDGLECFKRSGYSAVPGCQGKGVDGFDYCIDPAVKQNNYDTLTYFSWEPGTNLGTCAGDCDNGDCGEGLDCMQRVGNENVPGCGRGGKDGADYCYQNQLINAGSLNEFDELNLRKCYGDCDLDSHCANHLVCFQKDKSHGNVFIPGCGRDHSDTDFCYDPADAIANIDQNSTVLFSIALEPDFLLAMCGGNCDSDSDCFGDLECYPRSGSETIPGCGRGVKGIDGWNYCYDPSIEYNPNPAEYHEQFYSYYNLWQAIQTHYYETDCPRDFNTNSFTMYYNGKHAQQGGKPKCTRYTNLYGGVEFAWGDGNFQSTTYQQLIYWAQPEFDDQTCYWSKCMLGCQTVDGTKYKKLPVDGWSNFDGSEYFYDGNVPLTFKYDALKRCVGPFHHNLCCKEDYVDAEGGRSFVNEEYNSKKLLDGIDTGIIDSGSHSASFQWWLNAPHTRTFLGEAYDAWNTDEAQLAWDLLQAARGSAAFLV